MRKSLIVTVLALLAVAVAVPIAIASEIESSDQAREIAVLKKQNRALVHQVRGLKQRAADAKRRGERRGFRRARRQIVASSPDVHVAAKLAAIAYGQNWNELVACADSEGYDPHMRHNRLNTVPNQQGSGAFGWAQFMRGTYESTPQWKLYRLDWRRQDVQAHAMAWMFAEGRRGEWTGARC